MANVYTRTQPSPKPNRNAFDMSYANNLTMRIGTLYPVMCKEVMPGDSVEIDPTFGFRFMPMVFPVQTRMRADLHFFYVRNKNLWKHWKDFIGQTKEGLVVPYLDISPMHVKERLGTGSLADYLGVPTTVSGLYSHLYSSSTISGKNYFELDTLLQNNIVQIGDGIAFGSNQDAITPNGLVSSVLFKLPTNPNPILHSLNSLRMGPIHGNNVEYRGIILLNAFNNENLLQVTPTSVFRFIGSTDNEARPCKLLIFKKRQTPSYKSEWFCTAFADTEVNYDPDANEMRTLPFGEIQTVYEKGGLTMSLTEFLNTDQDVYMFAFCFEKKRTPEGYTIGVSAGITNSASYDVFDAGTMERNPFVNYDGHIEHALDAMPFRAYESIYNGFYRNQQNNPFMKNGVPEYNEFVTTDEDGADQTPYHLFNRDWEQDMFTTCLPSPQQGIAPLVGLTSNDDVQTATNGLVFSIRFREENTDNYTSFPVRVKDGQLELLDDEEGTYPQGAVDWLAQARQSGISINDFRNANALQHWLEKNMRNGFRYRDQVESHFGVELTAVECDMPEFIGGTSKDVDVFTVVQQSESNGNNVLGSEAGRANCIGGSRNRIYKYCDDYGFIIGIISISPIPVYSQVLSRMFNRKSPMDYFWPEFRHIGPQAVTLRDISPIQAVSEGKSLDTVFGYQRAYFEYLSSLDEVHGQFRTTLRNYLIDRVFGESPELGAQFLQIDQNDINDVFAVTDGSDDKIIGQVYFDMKMLRPISKFGEPRLE